MKTLGGGIYFTERALENASIPFIDTWADMVGFREWDYDKVISMVSDFIKKL